MEETVNNTRLRFFSTICPSVHCQLNAVLCKSIYHWGDYALYESQFVPFLNVEYTNIIVLHVFYWLKK